MKKFESKNQKKLSNHQNKGTFKAGNQKCVEISKLILYLIFLATANNVIVHS